MKIKIDSATKDTTLFEGRVDFNESVTENSSKPAFLINFSNPKEEYEAVLQFENRKELDDFIKDLQEL